MKKHKLFSLKYLAYDIIRIGFLPGLIWFRPKKYFLHEEDKRRIKGGALIISNHITFIDPIYLFLTIKSRRQHFICMDELLTNKFKRWLFTKCFLCVPITRAKPTFGEIKNIISHLKEGKLVSMFPEGRINVEKEGIQDFKSGMVVMAMRGNVPIIPIYLKRRAHFYSRLEVGVGSPIDVTQFKKGSVATHEEIEEACAYLQKKEKELEELVLKGK